MRIYEDLRLVQLRTAALQYGVVGVLAALLAVFWYLQVLRGRHYRELAENNQSRYVAVAAPRGPLLDRNGRVLVENRASFAIQLRPEDCADLDRTVSTLGHLLRIGEGPIRERLARRGAPFRPVVIKANASEQDVASIHTRRFELPAVEVDPVPLRSYPHGTSGAHALGRVGEVTERQLKSAAHRDVPPGGLIGQAGFEASYNRRLMGADGYRRVIVNSRGVEVREADGREAVDGPRLTLTLDADLQQAMEEAFGDRSGSGVALDPETGEILALVSRPAFDPNSFAAGIEAAQWAQLVTDPTTPLINRAVQGQYSPGSLFKIITAAAALEEGVITRETKMLCTGQISLYGTPFHCVAGGHGSVDLHRALAVSCNVYFYQVGVKLAIGRIARYARQFGLGRRTGIDLPGELPGLIPDPEWKQRVTGKPWYAGETVSVAIGQGQVMVTPVQMACVAACVANGGRLPQPHLLRAVGDERVPQPPLEPIGLKPETLEAVRDGLSAVVNEHGTGRRAHLAEVEVCGKTGSAQVVSRDRLKRSGGLDEAIQPHGWFIGFAPREKPRIAFAFLIEHGRAGGEAAAPVARKMLERFFGLEVPAPVVLGAQ